MSTKVSSRHTLSLLAAPLAATALTLLAACGGGSDRPVGTAPATADITVRAKDGLVWDETSYTASSADGPVELYAVNDSGLAHNLHVVDADDNDVADKIDLPSKGSNGTITLDLAPGEYRIVCKIPGHSGTMNATLTVD